MIENASASGDVTVTGNTNGTVGGLVGNINNGEVNDSTATGSVTVDGETSGSLVGIVETGKINNSTYTDVKAVAQTQFESAASSQAESTVGETMQKNTITQPEALTLLGNSTAADGKTATLLAGNITYAGSSSYSSNIKAIEVDGVRYNLEDDDDNGRKKDY